MTEAGNGIAFLPKFILNDALVTGRLVQLLPTFIYGPRHIYLLWPSGRQLQPKVRVFIDFMLEHCAGDMPFHH